MFAHNSKNLLDTCRWIALFFLFALFAACEPSSKSEKPVSAEPKKERKVMKLNIDFEREKQFQSAADQGFKPWKNKVVDVAEECIISAGIGAPVETKIISENETVAVVSVATKKEGTFKVTLKKLVQPGGIWTATEVEKKE